MSKAEMTKQFLVKSFRTLAAAAPLDQVTVTAVAHDAGVNRQTFYYHFHDLYDLMEWSFDQRMGAIIEEAPAQAGWRQTLVRILASLLEDRDLVIKTRHAIDSGVLQRTVMQKMSTLFAKAVRTECADLRLTDEELLFVSRYYSAGLADAVLGWVDEGMRDSPELVAARISLAMSGEVTAAISRVAGS